MKYFSIETVVNAYKGFQDCMTNKSWGYLAILKGCKSSICPSVPFEVDMDTVSNFLENVFNLSQTKKRYESGRTLYVVFSNKWDHYFNYQGKYSPNLFDIIVWAYRRKAFVDDITKEKLFQLFSDEFNIPIGVISGCFNIEPKEILFDNTLYFESDLKTKLNQIGVNVLSNNIDAKKASVVASPGEISRGPFVQTLYAGLDITDYVLILQSDYYSLYGKKKDISYNDNEEIKILQQIFYGAPGTGKSHRIKEQLRALNVPKENIFRTTFHPDSDFSTFVGAYKPTMKRQYRYDGKVKAKYYEDDDLAGAKKDEVIIDKVIQYDFVPQTFIKAYVRAYQTNENVYLIIEEINRGNCAQIFGDLFQLLDRDENGVSEYTIKADADIRAYLEDVLGCDSEGIKDGELCLPSNLYIYATMNTSDQSLFPIDSAFKRRWDWEYEPIKYKNADWVIDINGNQFSWTSFQKEVNNRIFESTNSEDKMLGDFFVKPYDGIITEKLLLNKVLFYLWNDVCKDGDGDIFKTEDNKDVKFSDLYGENGTAMLLSMMKHLNVELLSESDVDVEDVENGKDNTKYSINGSGSYAKRSLSTELVKAYISQHPEMPATEVVNKWKSLGRFVSHFIETQDEYDTRTDRNPRVNIIQCNGDNIYVSTNGWGGQGVMDSLINAIPKDWNLNVEKI